MAKDLATSLQNALVDFLSPLQQAARDPRALADWLAALGYTLAISGDPALITIIQHAAALHAKLSALNSESLKTWTGLASLLQMSKEIKDIMLELRVFAADPARALAAGELADEIMSLLLASYLRRKHVTAFRVVSLLRLVDSRETAALEPPLVENDAVLRYGRVTDRFRFSTVNDLITHPNQTLKDAYFPNAMVTGKDAWRSADLLFPSLSYLANVLGLAWHIEYRPTVEPVLSTEPDPEEALLDHVIQIDEDDTAAEQPPMSDTYFAEHFPSLRITIAGNDGTNPGKVVATQLLASSLQHPGAVPGMILTTIGEFNHIEQREQWKLTLSADGEIPAVVIGPDGLSLAPGDHPLTAGSARLLVERVQEDPTSPAFLFGSREGTRLELGTLQLAATLTFNPERADLSVDLAARSGALVLTPGDGDGFLSSILPTDGIRAGFDLGLAWSNRRGLTLRGSAGLDATLPIGMSVGGLTLSTVNLSLQARDSKVQAEVSTTLRVSIGPVQAVIERVGIAAALTFPENGGNLGVAELDIGFKSPTGVGLTVDASVVIGGGYLSFDSQKQEYRGVLELQILNKIAVKAVGLLTTQLPDGSKGYSLVLLIFAENFTPIQLGFGFALTGIGGLLGVNRTFNEEALRTGLKNHTLDSVMFPKDVVRNAPQIINSLNQLFPSAKGHHLFGPMAQITWGTPPLITADVGVVLEFGARLRLLILAQVVAILPNRKHDLVRLQMDAVGVLDFNQGTAALDAVLYNSRLLKRFVLTGEMAMRLKWEGSPNFALAVGGLHPAFSPPANFPRLERIAINLTTGDNPRLRCEAYFAITSNTVQFGARAELYAAAAGFNVRGEIGFDVLIQLDPFSFLADFYAQLQLRRGSRNLFKVRFEGTLAGPRPLHIRGKATFEILWWDVSIRVDTTLVHGDPPPSPEPIDVLPRLKEALSHPGNWVGQLPVGQAPMVTLRGRTGTTTDVLLHPLGTMVVKQSVVPLDMDISRFGPAAPAGARRFTISRISLGEQRPSTESVRDFFAPAQFFEMSDDEKLSRPSFESMPAGLRIGSGEFVFPDNPQDRLEVKTVEFETRIVDQEKKDSRQSHPETPDTLYALRPEFLGKQARFGAAGSSELRRTGRAKYRTTLVDKYQIVKEGWSIVGTNDLTVQPVPGLERGTPASYSEAIEALRRIQRTDPAKARGLKILRFQSEVQATGAIIGTMINGTTGSISGTVINADTEEPLSERVIRVAGSEILARTDIEGNFTLEGVPEGLQTVLFNITGFHDGITRTVTVVPGQSVSVGRVTLKVRTFTGTLIGQVVVDDTTRAPIPKAIVAITVDPPGESIPTETETDSDGQFEFLKFPAGFILITVSKEGFTSITLKGQVKEDRIGNAGAIRLAPN